MNVYTFNRASSPQLYMNDYSWTQQQMEQRPTTYTTSTTTYNFNDIGDNSGNDNNNDFAS